MSKLIERIKKVYQDTAPSMGFNVRTVPSKNQAMPFIAAISLKDMNLVPDILAMGIDALLLQINDTDSTKLTFTSLLKKIPDVTWGIYMNNFSDEQIDQAIKAGCDFIIFEAKAAPVSVIEQDKLGKLLIMNQALPDGLIEAAGQLPIDAIVMDFQEETNPSMLHLMLCQYYTDLTDKPLFSIVSTAIDTCALETLHKYGVDGIITKIKTKSSLKQAINLRQMINKLPPVKDRGRRKQRLTPCLGSSGFSSGEDEYEYEEI